MREFLRNRYFFSLSISATGTLRSLPKFQTLSTAFPGASSHHSTQRTSRTPPNSEPSDSRPRGPVTDDRRVPTNSSRRSCSARSLPASVLSEFFREPPMTNHPASRCYFSLGSSATFQSAARCYRITSTLHCDKPDWANLLHCFPFEILCFCRFIDVTSYHDVTAGHLIFVATSCPSLQLPCSCDQQPTDDTPCHTASCTENNPR